MRRRGASSADRRFSGFTLGELAVVLILVALVAGILFPLVARSRERSMQAQCAYNLKQMGVAFRLYAEDYDGVFPCPGGSNTRIPWLMSTDRGFHKDAPGVGIWPYVQHRENGGAYNVYSCPYAVPGKDDIFAPGQNYVMNDYLRPCHPGEDRFGDRDAVCGRSWDPRARTSGHSLYDAGIEPAKMGVAPARVILLYEAVQSYVYHGVARAGSPFFNQGVGATPPLCAGMPRDCHSGRSNFLFCDGHVQPLVPGATWRPDDQAAFDRLNFEVRARDACAPLRGRIQATGRYAGAGAANLWDPHLPRVRCP